MSLQQTIKDSIKEALKSGDSVRLTVVRGLSTAFMNELVATGRTPQSELSDEEVITVITREAKRRKDSIDQFTSGGRADLAESEQLELKVLQEFLPVLMSQAEIKPYAGAKQSELGITDKSKIGILIGAVLKELKGRADGGDVKIVCEQLFS